jgi:hypothetical protein
MTDHRSSPGPDTVGTAAADASEYPSRRMSAEELAHLRARVQERAGALKRAEAGFERAKLVPQEALSFEMCL